MYKMMTAIFIFLGQKKTSANNKLQETIFFVEKYRVIFCFCISWNLWNRWVRVISF